MSGKSIAEKLLIRAGASLWISDRTRLDLLGSLPDGVGIVAGPADAAVAIVLADDAASVREILADHGSDLVMPAALWVLYPKGNRSDLNRDSLWPIVAEHGMRPIGQVAVDDVWSALRFRPLRPGESQFSGGR